MRTSRLLAAAACSLLVSVAIPSTGSAFDLTGTWTGSWSCQDFDGSKFKEGNGNSTLLITQNGNEIAANLDGGDFLYNGGAIPDAQKPDEKGEVVLIQCGTDNLPFAGPEAEIVRAKVKTKLAGGQGSLKGVSFFENDLVLLGTCKYNFKRQDVADPNVSRCP